MKGTKALFYSLLFLFSIVMFTGCGAQISGKVNINPDGSGSRSISMTISSDDIGRINGGEKALDDIIEKNKPSALDYKKEIDGENRKYTFFYDFKSFKEYISKTQEIIGRKPDTTLEVSGGFLNRSYSFMEKDITLDLMKWVIDEVERTGLSGITLGELYEVGDTEVNLIGYKKYFQGDINVSADKQFYIEQIKIDLSVKGSKDFDRTIEYVFDVEDEKALNINGKLEKSISDLVPDGGGYQKTSKDSKVIYRLTFHGRSLDEINSMTAKAASDAKTSLSIRNIEGKDKPKGLKELVDSIDFMGITGGTEPRKGVTYTLKLPSNFVLRRVMDNNLANSGNKPKGVEITLSGDMRTIKYLSEDNGLRFSMEYLVPDRSSFIIIWGILIVITAAVGYVFIMYFLKRRRTPRGNETMEDTLSLDREWKMRVKDEIERNKR